MLVVVLFKMNWYKLKQWGQVLLFKRTIKFRSSNHKYLSKFLMLISLIFKQQILLKCIRIAWPSLPLQQRQEWLPQILIKLIKITGLQYLTSMDWNIVISFQCVTVMASTEERCLLIWRRSFLNISIMNSNTCFKNMKKNSSFNRKMNS